MYPSLILYTLYIRVCMCMASVCRVDRRFTPKRVVYAVMEKKKNENECTTRPDTG